MSRYSEYSRYSRYKLFTIIFAIKTPFKLKIRKIGKILMNFLKTLPLAKLKFFFAKTRKFRVFLIKYLLKKESIPRKKWLCPSNFVIN